MTIESRELFALCKQVYEVTGWKDTHSRIDDSNHTVRNEGNEVLLGTKQVPLYTSDYLLEKLPAWAELRKNTGLAATYTAKRDALVSVTTTADTPLKALLKLCLALHKEGLL